MNIFLRDKWTLLCSRCPKTSVILFRGMLLLAVYAIGVILVDLNGATSPNGQERSIRTIPDANLPLHELIESRGFKCERHWITTEDGYVLGAHRIISPFKKNQSSAYPVILFNAMLVTTSIWLWNAGGQAVPPIDCSKSLNDSLVGDNLAFELSNCGYDVWLVNSRCSQYSTNHTTLDTESTNFWKVSVNEMALDVPAAVDHVRSVTKSKHVGYVGYSDGALIAFATLSTRSEYNDILKPVILIAPAARYSSGPVVDMGKWTILETLLKSFPGQLLGMNKYTRFFVESLCTSRFSIRRVCEGLISHASGLSRNSNMERLPVYVSYYPAGISRWSAAHQIQMSRSGCFNMFDYGKEENQIKYGSADAPCFNLGNITNRHLGLIYSKSDEIISLDDVLWTKGQLKVPLIVDHAVLVDAWNHMDFVCGKNLGAVVNAKIISTISQVVHG